MKTDKSAPPPVIDAARVIVYASIDESVTYTGKLHLFVGSKRLGKVPNVAICKSLASGFNGCLIMFCNKKWECRGVVGKATLKEAKRAVESWYAGISNRFVDMNVSAGEARRWLKVKHADSTCSFCDRLYFECNAMISSKNAVICSDCVCAFARQIEADGAVQ